VSVSLSVTCLQPAKVAGQIDVLFGVEIVEDPRNTVLDGGPDFHHGFDAAFARLLCHVVPTATMLCKLAESRSGQWHTLTVYLVLLVPGLRIDPLRFLARCHRGD